MTVFVAIYHGTIGHACHAFVMRGPDKIVGMSHICDGDTKRVGEIIKFTPNELLNTMHIASLLVEVGRGT